MARTTVAVRLEAEQVEAIRLLAERDGTDSSGWLRRVATEGLARDAGTLAPSATDPVALMEGRRPRTFTERVAVVQVLTDTWLRELAHESDTAGDDPTEALIAASVFRSYAGTIVDAVERLNDAAQAMRKAQSERGKD